MTTMTFPSSASFNKQALQTYTVGGKSAGLFKGAGNFSYVRVTGAGHEVSAYKVRLFPLYFCFVFGAIYSRVPQSSGIAVGEAALQFFTQTMADQAVFST
jgi:hypothetical protein